jgi:hypothetical protein
LSNQKVLEKNLWKWLSACKGPFVHINRIENVLDKGTPDVEGWARASHTSTGFQIELKTCERPVRKNTKLTVKIELEQVEFMEARSAVGGVCYVLLQVGSGADAGRYLIPGGYARGLLNRRYTEADLRKLVNHPSDITPQGVLGIILSDGYKTCA